MNFTFAIVGGGPTGTAVFFKRNQGQIMQKPIKLSSWKLSIEGLVKHTRRVSCRFAVPRMPAKPVFRVSTYQLMTAERGSRQD